MIDKSIGVITLLIIMSQNSNGSVVFSNDLTTEYTSLAYSNAFSSNGNNWQRQSGAQRIIFDQSHQLSGLRWWGAMDNFFQTENKNLAGFEIILWNEDFSDQIINQSLTIEEVRANETGLTNINGEIYDFFTTFDHYVTSGTYYLNIGALYYTINDKNPWGGDGVDQWVWSAGKNNMYDQENSKNFLVTSNFPHTRWGVWTPTPLNIGSLTFRGGAAKIYAVPEIGSITLLGAALLLIKSKRRK